MNAEAAPSLASSRVLIPFALVTLIWGSTWIVITGQLGTVDPTWSVAYRFGIAGLAMLGYATATGHSLKLDRDGHIFALLFGIAQFAFNFILVYHAEQYVTSGLVAVVFALLIVPNTLLGRVFLGVPVERRFLAGSAIAILGVALLFVHEVRADPGGASATLTGIGLTFVAVMCASTANIMQGTKRARALPTPSLIGWGMLWGAGADALIALSTAGPPTIEPSFTYLGGLAYLSIMASAVAFSLYFRLVREIGPGKAAYPNVIIPVIAMFFSTLFEGYRWSAMAAAGTLVVLAGMLIALTRKQADSH